MKKVSIIALVLLLLFSTGCTEIPDAPKKENTTPNVEGSDTSASSKNTDSADDDVVAEPQFDDNTVLFACQDRADIEGDRYVVYYYNYKGELLHSAEPGQIGFYGENGLAPAYDPITGLVGFVDLSGVFVIEPQWDDAAAFSADGIALVILDGEEFGREKYGFINDKGEQIVPCIYDEATSFYPKGLAIIGNAEVTETTREYDDGETYVDTNYQYKYGVIDKKGNIIIEPQYDHIEHILGEYVVCKSANTHVIYDLFGNILLSQDVTTADGTPHYTYLISEDALVRHTWVYIDGVDTFIKGEVFDGEKFNEPDNISDMRIESRRVATTSTGYGFGIVRGEDVVVPFEYDNIIQNDRYFIAIKYNNGNQGDQTLDIYDESFKKTADGLAYNYYFYRTDSFGERIALPSGYFDVYVYDEDVEDFVHGIIDHTGQIIVPLLYYRGIKLYTYEGAGGKFVY